MSSNMHYVKAPGKLVTPVTLVLALMVIIGFCIIAYRYIFGIGAVSNLSDGYPWGIWLGYDVSVGSAFACGGYALAILAYIMNGWKYHPMIRSAIVASLFGYALAGFSVMVDIGRYWNSYGFFVPSRWQPNSIMFEVALCIMAYTCVLFIEFLPSALDRAEELHNNFLSGLAKKINPILDKVLIFIVVLGITLPTMHQSSLGSLFIVAGTKLHPLWQTNFLPLLFLINALYLGFSLAIFESSLTAAGFNRPYEREVLDFTRFLPCLTILWLAVRFISLFIGGKLPYIFNAGFYSIIFWAEIALIAGATVIFLKRPSPRKAFYAAIMLCLGGGLYRLSVYIIGYNPGAGWYSYFPAFSEMMITFSLVALEILAYIVLCRVLRLLPKVN